MTETISVIVCSPDDGRFESLVANLEPLLADEPHEVVRIPDAASMCEGYNRGVRQSHGGLLVFCHDDVEILARDLARKLRWYLERWDLVGVAGTRRLISPAWASAGPPHVFGQVAHLAEGGYEVSIFGAPRPWIDGIQATDGVFFAARRAVVEQVGFDEERFDGFHLYDIDFTYSAFRAGYRLVVANDLQIIHASGGKFDDEWQRYAGRFIEKHGALYPQAWRPFATAGVLVPSKEEILERTTPSHWDDAAEPPAGSRP